MSDLNFFSIKGFGLKIYGVLRIWPLGTSVGGLNALLAENFFYVNSYLNFFPSYGWPPGASPGSGLPFSIVLPQAGKQLLFSAGGDFDFLYSKKQMVLSDRFLAT